MTPVLERFIAIITIAFMCFVVMVHTVSVGWMGTITCTREAAIICDIERTWLGVIPINQTTLTDVVGAEYVRIETPFSDEGTRKAVQLTTEDGTTAEVVTLGGRKTPEEAAAAINAFIEADTPPTLTYQVFHWPSAVIGLVVVWGLVGLAVFALIDNRRQAEKV